MISWKKLLNKFDNIYSKIYYQPQKSIYIWKNNKDMGGKIKFLP